jgi:DNA-binding MarR family transcriptional regulator
MGLTCACYNLRRASRAVTQLFDGHFDAVGLKATQFTVLAVLAYAGDAPPTVTKLADDLVLDQSSLSRNLAVLERLGYVRLAPGADRRQRIVTLTRSGRSALARGYAVWKRAQGTLAGALGARRDRSDLEAQLRVLRRMTKAAQALRPRPSRSGRTKERVRSAPR